MSWVAAAAVPTHYGPAPLSFEPNQGQAEAGARYLARGPGYLLTLRADGAQLALRGRSASARVGFDLVGANPAATLTPAQPLERRSSYFLGNDRQAWRKDVPHFGQVRAAGVYPGIDLLYYGRDQQFEYDFLVSPGADPSRLSMRWSGADNLALNGGDLRVSTAAGPLVLHRPVAYQDVNGRRVPVEVRYQLRGRSEVALRVGRYDRRLPLVIDPVLVYSTYLGTAGDDLVRDMAVDANGNVYLTGFTRSAGGPDSTGSVYVTKLGVSGNVLWTTYYGGDADDYAYGIALDAAGNIYVVGSTRSTNLPILQYAWKATSPGNDGFVFKLAADNTGLLYSSYIGGVANVTATDIAVSAGGTMYITGYTNNNSFPTTPFAYQAIKPSLSAPVSFVVSLEPFGVTANFSTYVGGTGGNIATAIVLDSSNRPIIAGYLNGPFPVTPGVSYQSPGDTISIDSFVAGLSADGTSLLFASQIGGVGDDVVNGMARDGANNLYLTGFTNANATLPVTAGAYQSSRQIGFALKLAPQAASLLYLTYLGGAQSPLCDSVTPSAFYDLYRCGGNSIAVDGIGNATIVGTTGSPSFPATAGAVQNTLPGSFSAFLIQLNASGTAANYATLLGSTGLGGNGLPATSHGEATAVDALGQVYLAGETNGSALPASIGAGQPASAGAFDTFLAKFDLGQASVCTASVNPTSLSVGNSAATTQFTLTLPGACPWAISSDSSWVAVNGLASGLGTNTFTISVAANPLTSARTSLLSVAGLTIPVTQGGGSCAFSLSSYAQAFPSQASNGGTLVLANLPNCSWTASTAAPWISITTPSGFSGSNLTFSVQSNNGPRRTATIFVAGLTFTVTQAGFGTPGAAPGVFSDGVWTLDLAGEGSAVVTTRSFGAPGDIAVWGDWNGSGQTKLGVFRGGFWYLDMNGNGLWDGPQVDMVLQFGVPGDTPVVGNWNGLGGTKIGVLRNGVFYLDVNGSGLWDAGDLAVPIGQAGDTPVTGDWNGDGRTKVGVFRNGLWILDYFGNGSAASYRVYQFGVAGDVPVTGDWTGDRVTKIGVFRAGEWYLDLDANGQWTGPSSDRFTQFGVPGALPIVADWNGDGRSKIGVYFGGVLYSDNNGSGLWEGPGLDRAVAFGQAAQQLAAGVWQ